MKDGTDQRVCYLPEPMAEADNTSEICINLRVIRKPTFKINQSINQSINLSSYKAHDYSKMQFIVSKPEAYMAWVKVKNL